MHKGNSYYIFFILLLILSSDLISQTVNSGYNSSATMKAAITFRNFSSGGGQEVYLGNATLSSMNNINDVTWLKLTHVKFIYDGTGTITAQVITAPMKTQTYNIGSLGNLNYVEITVVATQDNKRVTWKNMLINSNAIADTFSAPVSQGNNLKSANVTGLTFNSGFTIEGDIAMYGTQPGGDANYVRLRVGYLVPPDNQAPVVDSIKVDPNYVEIGNPVSLTAIIDDSQTGNSNITSAEYSLDSGAWTAMTGDFTSPRVHVSATLSDLTCGEHSVCIRGTDALNNTSTSVCADFIVYEKGSVSGTVTVNSAGVGGVLIKLLDLDGIPTQIDSTRSEPVTTAGHYEFTNLIPGDYRLMIVLPIGYTTTNETVDFNIAYCSNDVTQNFALSPVPIINDARSKGYWKHQFDVYITGKGSAQETSAQLINYINTIITHYISQYSLIFNTTSSFTYWSDLLSYGGPDMYQKAKGQLAALVLNMASLKISQSEVVTLDNRDVADVITYASEILSNSNSTAALKTLAKDICESVCTQVMIASGKVPDFNILYKGLGGSTLPSEYSLANYPNPFNPSTIISYALPKSGHVSLKVYDILGNEIKSLVNENKEAGFYSVNFNPSGLSSGVYLYILKADGYYSAKKMLYLK